MSESISMNNYRHITEKPCILSSSYTQYH